MDETILQGAQRIEREWRNYYGLWDEPVEGSHPKEMKDDILDQVIDLWERAPNWHTLIELNRLYLRRRLPVCASYPQPPDAETDLFSNLLLLHSYGVITTNSCPGWEQPVENSSTLARQRSFLVFSIPTHNLLTASPNAVYDFIQHLMQFSEVVYVYIRFQYNIAPHGIQRDPNISGLMRSGSYNNLPHSDDPAWAQEGWDVDLDDEGEPRYIFFKQEQRLEGTGGNWTDYGQYGINICESSFQDDGQPRH